jgi:hypothetical protein
MSFKAQMVKVIAKKRREALAIQRTTIRELSEEVLVSSPVVSGNFRANWNPEIGFFNESTFQYTGDTGMEASVGSHSYGSFLALNKVYKKSQSIKLGQTYTMTNGLDYAYKLERMAMPHYQAPQGMLEINAKIYAYMMRRRQR